MVQAMTKTQPEIFYTDPRLAQVYDTLNPWAADQQFYTELAGHLPKRILDMGCGTGLLAVELARRGHTVIGADPAPAMLDIARNRPDGDRVTWCLDDASSLTLTDPVDLIVMSGHAFQVFLNDVDVEAALNNFFTLLTPDGTLAFETRNPACASWRTWTPDISYEEITVDGIGTVAVHNDIVEGSRNRVSYETHFAFPDGTKHMGIGHLRYLEVDEVLAQLNKAGFAQVALYGDWDGNPVADDRPEIIAVARKS
ncbi:MAG TPA: class I SAM-dependent methyltransferase [Rhodospirillaceae bacterium]|nr:methyltransferase type 11 [Rhodospirillaceae bacterium]MAX60995.1 methyltransferase type 11 [Rhodospirillaceae bacterium]MBB55733.1 methyltransferase type 11 [Rhodospirillaceae bacterium]HAJ21546.1 class I SAM-dependent methyltransferase [Rhodospirillaceae bacterium]HBM12288.1 class I SAM-dependent methyltransferase [Rhodospirillaceae bacterium]|tara:strand:+ start:210753 stop:211514 length:762 start_codon:yes stop_codon:yes gene_type:complete